MLARALQKIFIVSAYVIWGLYPIPVAAFLAYEVWTVTSSYVTHPLLYAAYLFLLYLLAITICLVIGVIDTTIWGLFYTKEEVRMKADTSFGLLFIMILYFRGASFRQIPLIRLFIDTAPFLALRSYSPKIHIGKDASVNGILTDPELTYIGNNTIIGYESFLVGHSLTIEGDAYYYTTARITIEDYAVIGGQSCISLGSHIGKRAIVEQGSVVAAGTYIGDGEVWGGNPAVFKRMANESETAKAPQALETPTPQTAVQIQDAIAREELLDIVSQALAIPREEVSMDLSQKNCQQWDSLGQLRLGMLLERRTRIKLPPQQLFQLRSVTDIEKLFANTSTTSPGQKLASQQISSAQIPTNPDLYSLVDLDAVDAHLGQTFAGKEKVDYVAELPINIAATFVANPLETTLQLWTRAFRIKTTAYFGDYGQIEQLLLSPQEKFLQNPTALNVVLVRPEDLISANDPEGTKRSEQVIEAIRQYTKKSGQKLIVSDLPPVISSFFSGNMAHASTLREKWRSQLKAIDNVHILEFSRVVEDVGANLARNSELEVVARTPYSALLYQRLAVELTRIARAMVTPAKKVLVLDCDGTLWGGVIGEDQISGIQLGRDHPGWSFRLFQEKALALKKAGVLLTIVSKNEEKDVWDVFANHPEMVLKKEDISAYRINWKPKSQNIRELAAELNLGVDAFVFADNSPVEQLEVATNAPEVTVLPFVEPEGYARILDKLWIFDAAQVTQEDSKRTEMMLAEKKRKLEQQDAGDFSAFLKNLELRAHFRRAAQADMARVAQLIQKTNQFNLSLKRRSPNEVQALQQSHEIYTLNVEDRFGDYGLVGVAMAKPVNDEKTLQIDTFLMSCRALGRGVEDVFLRQLFLRAQQLSLDTVRCDYTRGPRNQVVIEFMEKSGFTLREEDMIASLDRTPEPPEHLTVSTEDGDSIANPIDKKGSASLPMPHIPTQWIDGEYHFHHIGCLVKELESTKQFYEKLLGKKFGSDYSIAEQKVTVCFLPLNDAHSYLELVQPQDEQSSLYKMIDTQGVSFYHLGFMVRDIDSKVAEFTDKGCQVLASFHSQAFSGKKCVFIYTTDMHLLELIDYG